MAPSKMWQVSFDPGYPRSSQCLFGIACALNLLLWTTVFWVSIKAWSAEIRIPLAISIGFLTFMVLFLLFNAFFLLYWTRKSYVALVLTVVSVVGQWLSVLITAFSLFADDYNKSQESFRENPFGWIQTRRGVPLIVAFLFLPVFLCQIMFLNRHATLHGVNCSQLESLTESDGHYKRKATPYHGQREYVS